MRLLKWHNGDISLTYHHDHNNLPHYAILSHTWGSDNEEVSFQELMSGLGKHKIGYEKIRFCGQQAAKDNFEYFWVDTCCIDKTNLSELQMSINSMFKWYRDAAKCYVFLPGISVSDGIGKNDLALDFESAFRRSRWFSRGWTLQELIAPSSVEIFSTDYKRIGDKSSLGSLIHEIAGIPVEALQHFDMSKFNIEQRVSWVMKRNTRYEEDLAYSLFGMCDVILPVLYGEGRTKALRRLRREAEPREREIGVQELTNRLEIEDHAVLCITANLKTGQIAK